MGDPSNVVRESSVAWEETASGERFGWRRSALGEAAGGRKLGCSLYELPPGRRSWPYHYHCANEEAIYVLEGEGTLRLAGRETPIARGDYVALPVGPAGAHQVINTSERPLRYLCVSTMIEPEVAVYPDSGKIGLYAGSAPGGSKEDRHLFGYLPAREWLDYWAGEE